MTPAPAGAGKHHLSILLLGIILLSATAHIPGEGSAQGGTEKAGDAVQNTVTMNIREFKGTFLPLLFGRSAALPFSNVSFDNVYNANHPLVQRMGRIILELLIPIYMILILLTGMYYIWGAMSPRTRSHAKTMLQKLVMGMVACSIAFPLFNMAFDLNNFIVASILSVETSSGSRVVPTWWGPVTGFYSAAPGLAVAGGIIALIGALTFGVGWMFIIGLVCMLIALMFMPYLILSFRNVLLLVLAIFFPMTIFFMSFDFLKGLGYKLFKTTMTWIFIPVPMAIFILLSNLLIRSLLSVLGPSPSNLFGIADFVGLSFAAFAAWALVGMAPMMMTSLMRIAGGAFIYVGQAGGSTKLSFMGFVMQGYSAGALTQAAFQSQRMQSRGISQRETAEKYDSHIGAMGSGAPTAVDAAQPPPPYAEQKAIKGRDVFGLGTLFGAEKDSTGMPRASMGTAPEANYVSGVEYARSRAAEAAAKGDKRDARRWRRVARAQRMKVAAAPAGKFLRNMMRQTIGKTAVGKALIQASWNMTGYWEKDSKTGKRVFNYGWMSYGGMSRGAKKAAAGSYEGFNDGGVKGKGTPPAVKAAITAAGIALPAAILAAPIIGGAGLGLSLIGGAALATGIGTHIAGGMGGKAKERMDKGESQGLDETDSYVRGKYQDKTAADNATRKTMVDSMGRGKKNEEIGRALDDFRKAKTDSNIGYLNSHLDDLPDEKRLIHDRTRAEMGKKYDAENGEGAWAELGESEQDKWMNGRSEEYNREFNQQLSRRAGELDVADPNDFMGAYLDQRPDEREVFDERVSEGMGKKYDAENGEGAWAELDGSQQTEWMTGHADYQDEVKKQAGKRVGELENGEFAVNDKWARREREAGRRAELADHMTSGLSKKQMDELVGGKRKELLDGEARGMAFRDNKVWSQLGEREQETYRREAIGARARKLASAEGKDFNRLGADERIGYMDRAKADVNRAAEAQAKRHLYETGRDNAWDAVDQDKRSKYADMVWDGLSDRQRKTYMETARDRLGASDNRVVEYEAKAEAAKDSALLQREYVWDKESMRGGKKASSKASGEKDHRELDMARLEDAKNTAYRSHDMWEDDMWKEGEDGVD